MPSFRSFRARAFRVLAHGQRVERVELKPMPDTGPIELPTSDYYDQFFGL
jgi:hypothetical protein